MNSIQQFQLIDGTFTPDEARQILGAMVKSKIDFHTLVKHSDDERSGDAGDLHEKRLRALRDLDAELKNLIESALATGAKLKVKGKIEIALIE